MHKIHSEDHKITVIIPVYNAEQFLERCIGSVLSQTYGNFELILVDDGSTDSSLEMCRTYEQQDSRVRVVSQKNAGAASARNAGICLATGEVISFVDCDDYIDRDMYQNMISFMYSKNLDIVVCGRVNEYANGVRKQEFIVDHPITMSSHEAMERFLTWDGLDSSPCDKLYKSSIFTELRFPTGKRVEDLLIMPAVFAEAKNIGHIGKAFYHYCHRSNSASTSFNKELGLTLFLSVEETKKFVKSVYSENDLSDAIEYFSFYQYLLAWQILQSCRYEGTEVLKIKYEIKKCFFELVKNKKINLKNIVITILLFCRLFGPIWRIKHKQIR